jgi:integrase
LNDVRVKNAKPGAKRRFLWDAIQPNFGLQVSEKGAKSWYVVAPNRATGKQTWVCLGSYPRLSLQDARKGAGEALGALEAGKLPLPRARAIASLDASRTFGAFASEYQRRAWPGLSASTQRNNGRALERMVAALGPLGVQEIKRSMVLKVLRDIQAAHGNAAAHIARVVANKVFDLAAVGLDDLISPCTGIKPAHYQIAKEGEGDRSRILDDAEIVRVWNSADRLGYPFGPIYRLLMLLGLRREELGSIEWTQVDLNNQILNLPSSKAGIPLTIPLSDRCCDIFRAIPKIHRQDTVFGAPTTWSAAKARLDKLCGVTDWRTHDLRRTMRSGLGRFGVNVVVAEMCLGHRQSGIVGVYDRHSYLDERRAALLKWEQHVMGLVDPASKVVALRA